MKKINHIPIHLTIEGVNAEFEAVGWHYPAENGQAEEFDVQHLYYTNKIGECHDWFSLMSWPSINAEVIKQLKAVVKDGNL